MGFKDRVTAGRQLSDRLFDYRGRDTVILALPRGGVPVGRVVADRLGAPLDVLVCRKIGAPGNEEFALGAISARGVRVLNERALRQLLLPPDYLDAKAHEQQAIAIQREAYFRGVRPPIPISGKRVILIDDGIETGMTMRAAIADVQAQAPRELIVAAPVCAPDTYEELARRVDAIVTLEKPSVFFAVGQFYESFPQVTDEEARDALLASRP